MAVGYFDDKNREYVITDMFPRRKLLNYLWNDTTVCASDQFGCGTSWSVLDGKKRPIEAGQREFTIRNGERLIYIKDNKTGEFYSPNRNFEKLPFDIFECHVGLGYQKVIGQYQGVKTEFTTLVPQEGNVVLFLVSMENISKEDKDLDAYFYAWPKLDERASTGGASRAYYDEKMGAVYYKTNSLNSPIEYKTTFFGADKPIKGYVVSDYAFKGLYGSFENPEGLKKDCLGNVGSTFEEVYGGAIQFAMPLKAGEKFETVITIGFGKDYDDTFALAKKYTSRAFFDAELALQKEKNEESLGVYQANTPDEYINSMANIWLKRQMSLGKSWGRLYGKGFRDMMQDTSAFLSLDLPMARARIIDILRHQYEDGNPIRMYEPDFRRPYNDSGSWIPATVLGYLYESGDLSVLDEKIPYIKGDSYEHAYTGDGFLPYIGTEEEYTVFDHVQRAMDYLYGSRGERGLVLFREGDWNDSLNGAGKLNKGESVWLSIATVKAFNEFIEILDYCGKNELIPTYEKRRDEIKDNIMKYGWEDGYLIYGYDDYGNKIGSKECFEGKIYLNPQAWAALANLTDEKTLLKALDIAEERLGCDFGYKVCDPAYTVTVDTVGRVTYSTAGITENASVYNHGVAFKIVADCVMGRGDNAYDTFKMISYDNPKNPNSGVEPYAVSNMYIGPENPYGQAGFAPMAWVTGTAGWLYRALTEFICGVRPVKEGLLVQPCFPAKWDKASVTRLFRGGRYEITMIRSNENKVVFDGKTIEGNVLPIGKENEKHEVTVYFK